MLTLPLVELSKLGKEDKLGNPLLPPEKQVAKVTLYGLDDDKMGEFEVLGALMRRRPPAVPTIEPSQKVVWMWSRLLFDHVAPPSTLIVCITSKLSIVKINWMAPVAASRTGSASPTVCQSLSVELLCTTVAGDHVVPLSNERRSRRSMKPWSSHEYLRASMKASSDVGVRKSDGFLKQP